MNRRMTDMPPAVIKPERSEETHRLINQAIRMYGDRRQEQHTNDRRVYELPSFQFAS